MNNSNSSNRNSNRRRGRSNNRPQGGGGGGNQINRIDSRARGNAPQLLDKYKKLAQDAQHNGDRVQAEYYLQFADHYFRVINDNKLRQDEARAKRDEQGEGSPDRGNERGNERGDDDNRRSRHSRGSSYEDDDRGDDGSDADRGNADRGGQDRGRSNRDSDDFDGDRSDDSVAEKPARKPRSAMRSSGKPRSAKAPANGNGEIDIAVLPPAFGKSESDDGGSNEAPARKPALRARRKRTNDSEASEAIG